ncbi:HAD-IIA family hydrolase [Tessaracoccus flavus]|uniref:HAD family hydrolase n=1 Tax=Tessaracoccus flavus TaxID=1610493 RepID=A0A1Q2CBX7_9ACTN|nr:HAD-IIA family hydrolase [Tessaracoccus flavus]AQP43614.1 HAD family hydrolase [Tessaracoccus flavus]SDZ00919.1 Haloacid Dehalogenase Superfamily Class (subfamily) IIA [Tessaracoccus flavus]
MGTPTRWYDAYVFDLDGTIFLGDELLPGAVDVVAKLRAEGKAVKFLSNNATNDPAMYCDKLQRMGLAVPVSDIVNTIVTTVRWLSGHHPDAALFVIGEEPLQRALLEAGFRLTDDAGEIDIVVASYDRAFDYRKLQIAFDAIWFHERAFLIQTNPDRFCPYPGGRGEPDCAAMTAAIEAATGTRCRVSLGKPSPLMLTEALRGHDVDLSQCLMVGDRLATDIQMALDCGMPSALVLTGDSTLDDVSARPHDQRPTYVVEGLSQLLPH